MPRTKISIRTTPFVFLLTSCEAEASLWQTGLPSFAPDVVDEKYV